MAKRVMKPADRKKWIEALRSGQYTQGQNHLRNYKGQYCCLGVAVCAIDDKKPRIGAKLLKSNRFGLSRKLQNALATANDGRFTKEVVQNSFIKAGYDTMPELDVRDTIPVLGISNIGSSFTSIADWIEQNL